MTNSSDGEGLEFLIRSIQNAATGLHGSDPTRTAYLDLTEAYDFFNRELFGNALPRCLITMQRGRAYYGYFWGGRFGKVDRSEITDEIAINPQYLRARSTEQSLSTLVHEMCHLWQHHFGKPSRAAYHNRQWATAMEAVGLIPSHTGKPGGKRTGQRVSHYIAEGGPFDVASRQLISLGFTFQYVELTDIPGQEIESETEKHETKTKSKYSCQFDKVNLWGKPGYPVKCPYCKQPLLETRLS